MHARRLGLWIGVLVLAALNLAACGGVGGGGESPQEVTVDIAGSAFTPGVLSVVPVGTTVTWTNSDSLPHTVTADFATFDSDTLESGDTFSFTFTQAGTFPYYCRFHGGPDGQGMSGTVTVGG